MDIARTSKMRAGWLPALGLALAFSGGCDDGETKEPAVECVKGTSDCACRAEAPRCDEGLMCEQDKCVGFSETGGSVSDELARSCELLLVDTEGSSVLAVTFGDNVQGTFVRQPPNTAVTFISKNDAPFAGDAFKLQSSGAGAPELKDAKCADAQGAPLEGSPVSLGN